MKTKLAVRIASFILRGSVALATTPSAAAHPQPGASHAGQNRFAPRSEMTARVQTGARIPQPAALQPHRDWLAVRAGAGRAAAAWNDFLWLQSAGYPVSWLDECANSLERGVLMAGTPSTMLLDYWGEPVSRREDNIRGEWTQVWSYRTADGRTIFAVIVNDNVSQVLS